jgi:hypothetical protein
MPLGINLTLAYKEFLPNSSYQVFEHFRFTLKMLG